jgi:hypothetical protein
MDLIPCNRRSRDSFIPCRRPQGGVSGGLALVRGVVAGGDLASAASSFATLITNLCHTTITPPQPRPANTPKSTGRSQHRRRQARDVFNRIQVPWRTWQRGRPGGGEGFSARTAITFDHAPFLQSCQPTDSNIIIDSTSTPSPSSPRWSCSKRSPSPPTWWQPWSRRTQRRHWLGTSTLASSCKPPCRPPALHHRCIQTRQVSSNMLKGC